MTVRSKSQEFTVHDRAVLRVKRLVPIISVRILTRNSPSMTRVVSFRFIEVVQGCWRPFVFTNDDESIMRATTIPAPLRKR